jgi:hypothetical protein
MFVPNSFTPGRRQNDAVRPLYDCALTAMASRSSIAGEAIFETQDPEEAWDRRASPAHRCLRAQSYRSWRELREQEVVGHIALVR